MMLRKLGCNVETLVKISLCVVEGDDRVEFEYLYIKYLLNIQYSGFPDWNYTRLSSLEVRPSR